MRGAGVESVVLGAAGVSMLVCSISRVRAVFTQPTAVRVGLAASLLTYAVALLIDVGPVSRWLDTSVFGMPDLAVLISQVLTTVTAWCGIEMVVASAGRASARGLWTRLFLVVTAAVWQCATFSLPSSPAPELPVVEFYLQTRDTPAWQTYWVSFGLISGIGSIYLGVRGARYARQAPLWLSRGLWWVTAGSALTTTFCASIAASTFVPFPPLVGLLQTVVVALGAVLIGVGCVVPQIPDLRSRREILPVWRVVTDLYPGVRLSRSRPDLRRAVTEIQDAVVTARDRDEIASPLMRGLAHLPTRPASEFELTVAELCRLGRQGLSPWWDDETATPTDTTGGVDQCQGQRAHRV